MDRPELRSGSVCEVSLARRREARGRNSREPLPFSKPPIAADLTRNPNRIRKAAGSQIAVRSQKEFLLVSEGIPNPRRMQTASRSYSECILNPIGIQTGFRRLSVVL